MVTRLFLVANDPTRSATLRALAARFAAPEGGGYEAIVLDPVHGPAEARDLREGDVLVVLASADGEPLSERYAESQCARAEARGAVVLPVVARAPGETPRPVWRRELTQRHSGVHLDFSPPAEALAEQIAGCLAGRLRLARGETDLRAQPLAGRPGVSALAALRALDTPGADGRPGLLEQAARAIEARLLPTAIDCLQAAVHQRPTEPLLPYWSARLRLALNQRAQLDAAIVDASRAARLVRLGSGEADLERAAWMLAARAAQEQGREAAALEYLGEAMTGTLRVGDWLEIARHHAAGGHAHRALAALEEAFYLDATVFVAAIASPEFAFLRPDLQRMTQDLVARLEMHTSNLRASEERLLRRRGVAVPPVDETSPAPETDAAGQILGLIAEGRASAHRQVEMLGQWAVELVAEARRHADIRQRLGVLPTVPPELPPEDGWSALLRRFWPRFRHHWGRLEAAAEHQTSTRRRLADEERAVSTHLAAEVGAFLGAVEQFEAVALADPLFAPAVALAEARPPDVVVYPPIHDHGAELAIDREVIPEELTRYAPAKTGLAPGSRLYRLERHAGGFAGSRVGVYFQRAHEVFRAAS